MNAANKPQFVVCIDNEGYPASLELHKIYRVLPDEDAASDGDLRLIDESGEDYPCPATHFSSISVPRAVQESLLKVSQQYGYRRKTPPELFAKA